MFRVKYCNDLADLIAQPELTDLFLTVSDEMAMTQEKKKKCFSCLFSEVDEYRAKQENIRVRGKDCPKPVKTWAQSGVSLKILDVLKK